MSISWLQKQTYYKYYIKTTSCINIILLKSITCLPILYIEHTIIPKFKAILNSLYLNCHKEKVVEDFFKIGCNA